MCVNDVWLFSIIVRIDIRIDITDVLTRNSDRHMPVMGAQHRETFIYH